MISFAHKYGPWAVITGASSGIGAEFARQLAAQKLNLVLIARRSDLLQSLASSLNSTYGVKTQTITADVTKSVDIDKIVSETKSLDVGLLVNNAGIETHGAFLNASRQKHETVLSVNVTAVTVLAHAFGSHFVHYKKGGMILVSSMLNSGSPLFATYSATKAYVSNLAMALRQEWKEFGVDVLALEPGAVDTDMYQNDFAKMGWLPISKEICVKDALNALEQGKFRVTPGKENDKHEDNKIEQATKDFGESVKQVFPPELLAQTHADKLS